MKRLTMTWAAAVLASLALPGLVWAQVVKVGSGGKIEIHQGGAVEATGQVQVAGTGTPEIVLSNGGALRLGSGSTLSVGDGTNPGKLSAAGAAAPVITNRGTGNYGVTVSSTGTLAVTALQVLHTDANGLTLQAGSTPGTLSGITFDNIAASGTYIRYLDTSGSFTVSNCVFNDTGSTTPYNISTVAGTSALVMATVNNTGSRAGSAYENDHGVGVDNSLVTSTINWGDETSEPPPAPSGFAGAPQSTTQIQWSWNDVAGETGYEVQDDAHAVKGTTVANVVTYTEGSLSENALTSRHVNAENAAGFSPDSSTVAKYTKVHDPVAGDFSLTVISSTQIDVSIVVPPNGTAGQTGAEIDRSPDGSSWATVRAFSNTYSYSDTGLSPGTTYSYRVRFQNGDAVVTAYSPTKSAATPAAPPPGAPLITLPVSGSTTNDPTPTFSGTAPAGSIVRVFAGNVEIGHTTAEPSGTWTLTPTNPLSDGEHHFTVESSQGHWKLDEETGPTSADSSWNGNAGTHTGNPTPSEDVATVLFENDGSLQFDGANQQYVALGNPASLNFGGEITMAAWVKRGTSGYNIIFAHTQDPATLPNVTFYSSSDVYVVGTYDAGGGGHVAATGAYPGDVNQWVHFAGVYDGTTWRLYRNGTEIASAANGTGAIPIAGNWAIGAAGTGNYGFFTGKIDDARIYNRGLSPAEVAALAQGKPAAPTTVTDLTIDTTPLTVTINQAAGQNDPTTDTPIHFTAIFNKSVADFETGDITPSGTAEATTATISGSGTTYDVAVSGMPHAGTVIAAIAAGVAHDAAGNANQVSTSDDNEVTYGSLPAAPANLTAQAGDQEASLNWDDNTEPDLAGYNVYRAGVTGGPYEKINTNLVVLSQYLDTGLTNGTPYFYVVRAVNTAQQESGNSNEVTATPQGTPPAPVITTADDLRIKSNTPIIQGTAEPNVTITVYFNDVEDGTTSSGTGTWAYTATSKTEGTYSVYARASNGGEQSVNSNTITLTVDLTAPEAPSNVRTLSYNGAVQVLWDASPSNDVAGYNVYRKTGTNGTWDLLNTTGVVLNTEYRDAPVDNGTAYFYRVTAVDTAIDQ